jgi:hypothetical protein
VYKRRAVWYDDTMNDEKKTPAPKPKRRRPRVSRAPRRDCPECFREYGHERWCRKSD